MSSGRVVAAVQVVVVEYRRLKGVRKLLLGGYLSPGFFSQEVAATWC